MFLQLFGLFITNGWKFANQWNSRQSSNWTVSTTAAASTDNSGDLIHIFTFFLEIFLSHHVLLQIILLQPATHAMSTLAALIHTVPFQFSCSRDSRNSSSNSVSIISSIFIRLLATIPPLSVNHSSWTWAPTKYDHKWACQQFRSNVSNHKGQNRSTFCQQRCVQFSAVAFHCHIIFDGPSHPSQGFGDSGGLWARRGPQSTGHTTNQLQPTWSYRSGQAPSGSRQNGVKLPDKRATGGKTDGNCSCRQHNTQTAQFSSEGASVHWCSRRWDELHHWKCPYTVHRSNGGKEHKQANDAHLA